MSSPPPTRVEQYTAGISSNFVPVKRARSNARKKTTRRRKSINTIANNLLRQRGARGGSPVVVDVEDGEAPMATQPKAVAAVEPEQAVVAAIQQPEQQPLPQVQVHPFPEVQVQPLPEVKHQPFPQLPNGGYDFLGISQAPSTTLTSGGVATLPSEAVRGCFRVTFQPGCAGESSVVGAQPTFAAPIPRNPFRKPFSCPYYGFETLPVAPRRGSSLAGANSANLYRVPVYIVRVCSLNPKDPGMLYNIREDETFEHIYDDYATRVDRKKDEITIQKYNGMVISRSSTPLLAGVRDMTIFVRPVNPEHNVDTRVKQFFLRGVVSFPIKVKVVVDPNELLGDVIKDWGIKRSLAREQIIVMYEDEHLSSAQTVKGAKIKNEYDLFLMPNRPYTLL